MIETRHARSSITRWANSAGSRCSSRDDDPHAHYVRCPRRGSKPPLGRPGGRLWLSGGSGGARAVSLGQLGQVLVNECNRHAAFADTRRDALDRAVANVARGENAGNAGLEQIRIARERPRALPSFDEIDDVAAGTHITALIPNHRGRQPGGIGVGADEHEQRLRFRPPANAAAPILDDDRLEMVRAPTRLSPSSRSARAESPGSAATPTTSRATTISAPKRLACCNARLPSSSPATPVGKPR